MPGGVDGVLAATAADVTVVSSSMMPSANDVDDDRRLRTARTDNSISAVLHTGYPVRHWDHDLGPELPHLFDVSAAGTRRDLTPQPASGLRDAHADLSPDGSFIVTTWQLPAPAAATRSVLVRIDVATGERTVLVDDPDADHARSLMLRLAVAAVLFVPLADLSVMFAVVPSTRFTGWQWVLTALAAPTITIMAKGMNM